MQGSLSGMQFYFLVPVFPRIESGAEASTSSAYSAAASAAAHAQMYAPAEQVGRNNNQTSCICGKSDVGGITIQCEVIPLTYQSTPWPLAFTLFLVNHM